MSINPTSAPNWHAEFISCNTSPTDQNTQLNAFYVGQQLYFHFMLMGGSPGDKITVNAETIMNDQLISVSTLDTSVGNGSGFFFSVIPNVAGKLTLRLYYRTENGEKVDLQGAYVLVQNNAANKPAEKKNKKKEPGFIWVVLLAVLIFVVYLAANNKIQIPGFDYIWPGRTTASSSSGSSAVSTSGSSSSSSASSAAGSSSSSSAGSTAARSGNRLEGTTWKYERDAGSYGTISFSEGTCTMTAVNTATGEHKTWKEKYTIHGNQIDCELIGNNVPWEISGNQLILTIDGERTVWNRQ